MNVFNNLATAILFLIAAGLLGFLAATQNVGSLFIPAFISLFAGIFLVNKYQKNKEQLELELPEKHNGLSVLSPYYVPPHYETKTDEELAMNRKEKLKKLSIFFCENYAEDSIEGSNFDCEVLDAFAALKKRWCEKHPVLGEYPPRVPKQLI